MSPAVLALARVYELYLLILLRTGFAAKLSRLEVPVAPETRAAWLLTLAFWLVLLLYAALAAGPDSRVHAFRVFTLVFALMAPLAGIRVIPGLYRPVFGGLLLLVLVAAGITHRALARRRRPGIAARLIERARLAFEVAGLALLAWAAALIVREEPVPVGVAFWSLFLLRLSVADLLDPKNLARETGLTESAKDDLRAAAAKPRRKSRAPSAARRLGHGASGLAKLVLFGLWLSMPLLSAIATGEVETKEWPEPARLLTWYPMIALVLTAAFLVVRGIRHLRDEKLEAVRALLVAVATFLWLDHAFRDPAFQAYRTALPGLYAVEIAATFLLGATRGAKAPAKG